MAFLTALLSGLGGYARGKQQQYENREQQQRDKQTRDYEQGQLGIEAQNAALNRQMTQQQLEAAQRENAQASANRTFESGLKLPPNWAGMTPDQKTSYLLVRQNAAARAGDTNIVNETQKQLDQLYGLTKAGVQAQARANLEQAVLAAAWQRALLGANTRVETTTMNNDTSRANNENTVQGADTRNIRTTETSTANNERTVGAANARNADNITQRYMAQSNNDLRDMERQNSMATREGKPTPYPNLDAFKAGLGQAIAQVSRDPKRLKSLLDGINAHAQEFGPQLVMYARRVLQDAARDAQQQSASVQPGVTLPPAVLPNPKIPPLPIR